MLNIGNILLSVAIVGGIGLIFGCLLTFSSFIFAVEKDERVDKIIEALPGANCGGCGYAGCAAYAEAVVRDGAPLNGCSVGKAAAAEKIAEIMGAEAEAAVSKTARVMCKGTCGSSADRFEYSGVEDCRAAARLGGGQKECPNGCLGFGTCARVCPFGAITVSDGAAVVDEEKCTACGSCIKVCPKHIIELVPSESAHWVECSNTERGAAVNKYCSVGCIGCKMCEKVCPAEAIRVENNLARIDYSLCVGCGACAEKCPKGVIHIKGAAEENS